MLLRHVSASLAAIHEGIDADCIALFPSGEDADVASDPAPLYWSRHRRSARLLCRSTTAVPINSAMITH
jgi:hypothetical protein